MKRRNLKNFNFVSQTKIVWTTRTALFQIYQTFEFFRKFLKFDNSKWRSTVAVSTLQNRGERRCMRAEKRRERKPIARRLRGNKRKETTVILLLLGVRGRNSRTLAAWKKVAKSWHCNYRGAGDLTREKRQIITKWLACRPDLMS